MNGHRVKVRVSGPFACFSRPEMKVERVSYEVMTPSAARGILDCILWKPEMRWVVHSIEVLSPIRFIALKRNEIQSKVGQKDISRWMNDPATFEPLLAGAGEGTDGTPRNTLALANVAYNIEASPMVYSEDPEDSATKYVAMFNRRVEKGQCFHRPCLGCREFAAEFEPVREEECPIDESMDLGLMLYDIAFNQDSGNSPVFFPARLERGVVNTDPEMVIGDVEQRGEVVRCSYNR